MVSGLAFNLLSFLTFLVGGLAAYAASSRIDVDLLQPFAAGNFIYIAAADLIPEVKRHEDWRTSAVHSASFSAGLLALGLLKLALVGA